MTDAATAEPERLILHPRHDQTFPRLSEAEIDRLRRFGAGRRYRDGEALFLAGEPGPGMFILLDGTVAITQRDALGRRQPVVEQGPGEFLAEVGQLSGRPALVDGHAEGEVETILIPPEGLRAALVAEAELGERIIRALILRRVSLIQAGHGGPLIVGSPDHPDVARLSGFLRRNGQPHKTPARTPTPPTRDLVDGQPRRAGGPAAGHHHHRHGPAQPDERRARRAPSGMIGAAPRHALCDVVIVGAGPAGLAAAVYAASEGLTRDRSRRARLRRPGGGEHAHRELSRLPDRHLRPGAGRARLRAGREVRRRDHQPGGGAAAGLRRPGRTLPARARRRRHGDAPAPWSWRAARATAGRRSRASPSSRAAASGTGPRRSRRGSAPGPRWRWSAAATRPARRRCTCRPMRRRCGCWCAAPASPRPCRAT